MFIGRSSGGMKLSSSYIARITARILIRGVRRKSDRGRSRAAESNRCEVSSHSPVRKLPAKPWKRGDFTPNKPSGMIRTMHGKYTGTGS